MEERHHTVIPAKAGIHWLRVHRDPCLRRDDSEEAFFDTGDDENPVASNSQPLTLHVLLAVLFLSLPAYAQTVSGLQCGSFRQVGKFTSREIAECSGLVVSRKNPGVLWVHNDSGDSARLFAVREDGSLRGIFHLARAESEDWEDLALGPCRDPGKECLYVGDIGDNMRDRRKIQIYRVEEPAVPLEGPPVRRRLKGTERFDCTYPDGPHDAEALFVDPASGIPYLITKEHGGSAASVYRFPAASGSGKAIPLEKVATLPSRSSVTGGDITQDGSMILLRDYFFAYGYFRPRGGGIPEAFGLSPFFRISYATGI
ncbi:MAG: hypothetical protein ACWGSD_17795, partial [Thermodesulfobacteriota bacterium]